MNWRGKELTTIGDLSNAVSEIVEHGTREDAVEFMNAYRLETPHAEKNIGYLAGYFGASTADRIWDWFGCSHPIFGREHPTPEQAFEAGKRMAAGEFD